jgi:hypothetical protein
MRAARDARVEKGLTLEVIEEFKNMDFQMKGED